jgi:hypothetical protein
MWLIYSNIEKGLLRPGEEVDLLGQTGPGLGDHGTSRSCYRAKEERKGADVNEDADWIGARTLPFRALLLGLRGRDPKVMRGVRSGNGDSPGRIVWQGLKGVSRTNYAMPKSISKYTRIQLDMPAERVAEAEALMAKAGLRTRKELFDNALTLFEWAVRQRELGSVLAAVDERTGNYREVLMPALAAVKSPDKYGNNEKASEVGDGADNSGAESQTKTAEVAKPRTRTLHPA